MVKTCPSCGKTYETDIRFCLECGSKLVEAETPRPAQKPSTKVPEVQAQQSPQETPRIPEPEMSKSYAPTDVSPKPSPEPEEEFEKDLLSDLSDKVASMNASLETVAEMNLLLLKKINEIDKKISTLLSQAGRRKERQSKE